MFSIRRVEPADFFLLPVNGVRQKAVEKITTYSDGKQVIEDMPNTDLYHQMPHDNDPTSL